ncbi:MAG: tRNA lysidine(34) synthetase TilS [Bacteroidota bacterium]|nr:tRNA lysidine(34) synthetase TilS [Bacteroidota bacterium]
MLDKFDHFIENNSLIRPGEKTLLTVSGGIDSVSMCEFFAQSGRKFGIAHCNFQLRGKDSSGDEEFVQELAKQYHVPFYCHRFQTHRYANEKKISIQMAARELRYNWFFKVAKKEKYDCIATAHHLDDELETFFINLFRSTGIAGLHGILPRQGMIIHPLLFLWRSDIEKFVADNHLTYREDRTNKENKYLRNKIRHQLIPLLVEINPDFKAIMTENIRNVRNAETIYREYIDEKKKEAFSGKEDEIFISVPALKNIHPLSTFLFEFLFPYGFTASQANDIAGTLDDAPGAVFFSPSWRLIKDRERYIMIPLKKTDDLKDKPEIYYIHKSAKRIHKPLNLSFEIKSIIKGFRINPSEDYAYLDMAKLTFPLTLRKWQPGDMFYPFGKYIRKKISDFFIDEKFSIPEKESTWILCSGERIVWIVGHRIDHRFRITNRTKDVFVIRKMI